MSVYRCKLWAFALVLALGSPAFSLEWYKAYMKGQDAITKGDCSSGQPLILQALQQNPQTGLRVAAYGTFRMEYIPHFYLALCAFEKGDVSAAGRYLKEAETSGVASSSKAKEYVVLKGKIQARLQEKGSPPSEQPGSSPPPAPSPAAPSVTTSPSRPSSTAPVIQNPRPAVSSQPDLVTRSLQEARSTLNSGDFAGAEDAANRVILIYPNHPEALQLLEQIRRQVAEASRKEKEKSILEVRRFLQKGELQTAENMALKLMVRYPSDSEVESLSVEIQRKKREALAGTEQAEQRKATERTILVSYFQGQYQAVIELSRQALEKDPNNWRILFFQGCSYAALSFLEEQDKDAHLKLARDSFRKARQITANVPIPPQISPKIVEIYRTS